MADAAAASSNSLSHSLQSWISKVLCSSVEKGFVGEGVVRWRERLSSAAHWASKASSCCCEGGGCAAGDEGASWAQLSAPLKVTLPLDGWRGAGFMDCRGFVKGLTLPMAGVSCWGAMDGKGWGGVAEPNTLATICEGVMPTTGTLGWGNASPLDMG